MRTQNINTHINKWTQIIKQSTNATMNEQTKNKWINALKNDNKHKPWT